MKNRLLLLLFVLLFSCSQEDETKIYNYDWRWNMQENEIRQCGGFDIAPQDADVIDITIESDEGEFFKFYNYIISDNLIVLTATKEFRNENYSNPELIRLNIKLIVY